MPENKADLLFEIAKKYAAEAELSWISQQASGSGSILQKAFVAAPRFLDKTKGLSEGEHLEAIKIGHWSFIQLVRVYFLTKLDCANFENYTKTLDLLFETAENNEAIALISALPFLDFPEKWLLRATDAVRSNNSQILEAIAFHNPYPKIHFSEQAWNQMILKCIFNDKAIHRIDGLHERANKELASSISYLAHERWAAGRTIPPQTWRLVSNFLDESFMTDISTLFASKNPDDRLAAAIVCTEASLPKAKEELKKHTILSEGELCWQLLEK